MTIRLWLLDDGVQFLVLVSGTNQEGVFGIYNDDVLMADDGDVLDQWSLAREANCPSCPQ